MFLWIYLPKWTKSPGVSALASQSSQYVHILHVFQDSEMIPIFFISKCFRFGFFHHAFNHLADDQWWKYETPSVLTNMLMLYSRASASPFLQQVTHKHISCVFVPVATAWWLNHRGELTQRHEEPASRQVYTEQVRREQSPTAVMYIKKCSGEVRTGRKEDDLFRNNSCICYSEGSQDYMSSDGHCDHVLETKYKGQEATPRG